MLKDDYDRLKIEMNQAEENFRDIYLKKKKASADYKEIKDGKMEIERFNKLKTEYVSLKKVKIEIIFINISFYIERENDPIPAFPTFPC